MENKIWYAVMRDNDDNDWGTGSFDKDIAIDLALSYRVQGHEDAYIAVIDDEGKVCIDEIRDLA